MADVAIDSSISTSTARGMRSVVFTTTLIGYQFYIDTGTSGFKYSKTTDGGATWGAGVLISAAVAGIAFDVWFDQWTPGDSGTLIHMWYFEATNSDVFYRTLDTASDTLGTQRTVFAGATAVAGRGAFVSGSKMRSGYLYCAYDIDAGAEKGLHRSTDAGVTWSANLATTFVEATIDQCLLFPASGTGDNNDCWALYHDASADALTLKMWDSSAVAQVESATIMALVENVTDLSGQYAFSGSIRHSDGHLIFAAFSADYSTSHDFRVFDVTSTSTFTEKTKIVTATANQGNPAVFIDQLTDDIYVAYEGKRDGTESANAKAYYTKSTDDGTTWSSGDTAYMEGAASANIHQVWAPLMGARFYVSWRDGTLLNGNAVNSVSFTSGTTFSDSRTDALTAAETETSSAVFAGARTDSSPATDTQAVIANFVSARSEALTATDTGTGNQTSSASRTDALTAADTQTGGLALPVARTESVTVADLSTGGQASLVARSDSLTVADSQDATTSTGPQVYNVAVNEALSAADSETGPVTYPVARTESSTVTAGQSSSAFFAGLRAELLATSETPASTAVMFVSRLDALSALDSSTGEFTPTGATFTMRLEGGSVMTLSIIAGSVLSGSIAGGPVLTGSLSGGPI